MLISQASTIYAHIRRRDKDDRYFIVRNVAWCNYALRAFACWPSALFTRLQKLILCRAHLYIRYRKAKWRCLLVLSNCALLPVRGQLHDLDFASFNALSRLSRHACSVRLLLCHNALWSWSYDVNELDSLQPSTEKNLDLSHIWHK